MRQPKRAAAPGSCDAHTHTTFSDGRNTVLENARAAEAAGLEAVVITDHIFGPVEWLGRMLQEVEAADARCGVKVLAGAEGTILNPEGEVSVPEEVAEQLDLVLVDFGGQTRGIGLDPPASDAKLLDNTVAAITNACRNSHVDGIAHPLNLGRFRAVLSPVDFGARSLIKMATVMAETRTAFEIMNQLPWWFPDHSVERITAEYADVLRVFKEYGVGFLLGSDAHSCGAVGNFRWCYRVMELAGISTQHLIDIPLAGERPAKISG
jgi:histidinol phosphatase-like PHP family hydrolase